MDQRAEQAIERLVEINHGLVLKAAAINAENALLRHEIEVYRNHFRRMIPVKAGRTGLGGTSVN